MTKTIFGLSENLYLNRIKEILGDHTFSDIKNIVNKYSMQNALSCQN